MAFFKLFLLLTFLTYGVLLASLAFKRYLGRPKQADERERGTPPECDDENSSTMIEVINVEKCFDHPVLEGVSLKVVCGETVGILGQSGTGKSVLLKLIAGFLKPDSGMILFKGRDVTGFSEDRLLEMRKRVSYVFQGGAFFDFINVRENVAFPLRERGWRDEERIQERVDYLLDAVELEGMGDLHYSSLSEGAKKQVAIARSIAIDPDVILYDEPTTGVDPIIGKSLSRLIRKLGKSENLTSVVVTHDLKCLEIVADRIILLKDGRIRFEGAPEKFATSEDPFVKAFRLGQRFEEEAKAAMSA